MIAATPSTGQPAEGENGERGECLTDVAHSLPAAIDSLAETWQRELARAVTDPRELCRLLDLDPAHARLEPAVTAQFRLLVPHGFVRRMRRGDPDDPLLRQVLPSPEELSGAGGFVADPLGEHRAMGVPGLLRKYHGRALLVVTGACAVRGIL